jgi:hypothetical protein
MNEKNAAVALMAGLSYEVLLKLCRTFLPALLSISSVAAIASALSFLVGVLMILFLIFFYQGNRSNQGIARVSVLLVVCSFVRFVLRLPAVRDPMGFSAARFAEVALGLVTAFFLFLLVLWFRRSVPAERKSLRQAATLLITLLAVGLVSHVWSLVDYAHFVNSEIGAEYPPAFYHMMMLLFILTHVSAIYFLFRYTQFKATPQP